MHYMYLLWCRITSKTTHKHIICALLTIQLTGIQVWICYDGIGLHLKTTHKRVLCTSALLCILLITSVMTEWDVPV